jgi:hypothetical protein
MKEEILYNILWIDDEHEALKATKGRAKRNGINLYGFKSLNGGMSELEQNYPFYDGVLLDAKFFENEDDVPGSEDTYNVHRAKEKLLQLKKKFEVFILTGQAEAYEDKTFKKSFTKVYKKGTDDDIDRLFSDIKISAACQEDTQLRHAYIRVFDVCTEHYIGEYAAQDILNLLKVKDEANSGDNFNAIRKIVEDLFSAFHKFKLLPDEFMRPNLAINQSSIFLSGKFQNERTDNVYKQRIHLEDTHLPQRITDYLKSILNVTQSGSHRSNIDDHLRLVKTPYLLKSTLFQLLDVLVWFKMYVDSKPKTENWKKIDSTVDVAKIEMGELIRGIVININIQKGFAFFQPDALGDNVFITPNLVVEFSLKNDMPIQVEIEEYTDNRDGVLKTRVKHIII